MNPIKTIIVAATASIILSFAAQAAEQTFKPLQGVSFHSGTRHAVAYFLHQNATCKLVLTIADDAIDAPWRFEAAIADGSSKQYGLANGKQLVFGCRDGAQAMTVNTLTTVVAQN